MLLSKVGWECATPNYCACVYLDISQNARKTDENDDKTCVNGKWENWIGSQQT